MKSRNPREKAFMQFRAEHSLHKSFWNKSRSILSREVGLQKVQKNERKQTAAPAIVHAHTSNTLSCTQKLPSETGKQITAVAESNTAYNNNLREQQIMATTSRQISGQTCDLPKNFHFPLKKNPFILLFPSPA